MEQVKQEKRVAEVLAEFVVNSKYEDLPKATKDQVKRYVLDVIGCTIGSSRRPQITALADVVKGEGGNPYCTVFAHGFKTSPMNAALLNGTMGHALDFDDDHREGTMHPSVAVFPAVFAKRLPPYTPGCQRKSSPLCRGRTLYGVRQVP